MVNFIITDDMKERAEQSDAIMNDIDEMVIDCCLATATRVNNDGINAQIAWLQKEIGAKALFDWLSQAIQENV